MTKTKGGATRWLLFKLVFGWVAATTLLTFFAAFTWRHEMGLVSKLFWTALALWVGLSFPWRNRAAIRLLFTGHFGGSKPVALKIDAGGRTVFECPGCGQDAVVDRETAIARCPGCRTEFNVHV